MQCIVKCTMLPSLRASRTIFEEILGLLPLRFNLQSLLGCVSFFAQDILQLL